MKLRLNKPVRESAARILPRLATQFFKAMDSAMDGDLDAAQAHDLRILAKRLKYSMEYFRPYYGETMDAYLNNIRELQRAMGKMSDANSSRMLLRELVPARTRKVYKKLFEALKNREEEALAAVRTLWREELAKSLTRKRLLRYLSHPPAPRPAPSLGEIGRRMRASAAAAQPHQHYH